MNIRQPINRKICLMLVMSTAASIAAAQSAPRASAFGLKTTPDSYILNTGAHSVFTIARENGELLSMKFNGVQMQAPFDKAKRHSHYASGLGKATITTATVDPANRWIKITCDDEHLGVTQYFIVRKGFDNLYMATYAAKLPSPGEMRYVTYLSKEVFPNVPSESNVSLADAVVEGKDVFVDKASGHTHSKFYAATPFIDDYVHGATGKNIGAFMNTGDRETASGGPFFRDIEFQTTGSATEMYDYMYSGHTQTEPFRPGLHGPYALQFTAGEQPAPLDYSFISELQLKGYVPASQRGTLSGQAGPVAENEPRTIGLSNAAAEYWARPDDSGRFVIHDILPGVYTQTLYQGQLAVATHKVSISAGATTVADIIATRKEPPAIFRIGRWDGTPYGFMNAEKIATMHPSDSRMKPWKDIDYVVGTSKESDWPLAEFMDVNNDLKITFDLSSSQAETPLTLRVGITLAFQGGRPQITVNAGQAHAWKSALPEFSDQPTHSRGITRGTFRGNNFIHAFNIPTAALHAGRNTIDLSVGSGHGMKGFLSPSITFDAIDLVPTAAAQ